jgi:hypothetical protein
VDDDCARDSMYFLCLDHWRRYSVDGDIHLASKDGLRLRHVIDKDALGNSQVSLNLSQDGETLLGQRCAKSAGNRTERPQTDHRLTLSRYAEDGDGNINGRQAAA